MRDQNQNEERNPYLASLPVANGSIFGGGNGGETPGLASAVTGGGKIIGGIVGGVAGAYAGGPMGALKGASTGMAVGEAAGGAAVKTLSLDGKKRTLWDRLSPDQKSITALQSLKGGFKA